MNKIKSLFLLALIVGLMGGLTIRISAQTGNKVLVSAGGKNLKQSDVDQLIKFYEWAFEAQFNSTQRRDFEEYTTREFRHDPVGSRATIDDITGTLPKILAAAEDVQAETRKNFLAAFLPEARKNTDLNSQMLLSIYETAHGVREESGSAGRTNIAQDDNAAASPLGDISALAGKWVWGRSGSSTYTTGGAFMGANGSRHTYQFSPGGMVEYTGIMNVMTGGCTMQIFKTAKGKASLSGNTLTVNWSPASFSRDDSCDRAGNYKKTLPAETEKFQIKFKTDDGQKRLCLTGKDETCFSPSK
jgi:hypothetical protein